MNSGTQASEHGPEHDPDGAEALRHLALVTSNYPYEGHPNVGTFVASLANAWARRGIDVDVIAPLPVYSNQTGEFTLCHPDWRGESEPTVRRPGYLSLSSRRIGPFSMHDWTTRLFGRASDRAFRQIETPVQLVYSHFLFPAGWAGLQLARRAGCPAVVALGESSFEFVERMQGRESVAETVRAFDAIVSVSQENASIVSERYGADPNRIRVFPNAVDTERFRPHDRAQMRAAFGLPADATILSFVGYFIDRKGPLRVLEAMEAVPGLYGVFLGEGPEVPTGDRVLHAGRVPNEDVSRWLSASDFFVLPTRAEGSPNAILEAMACGLPVISSNIPALAETADDECAILVGPDDIAALTEAMRILASEPERRERMGNRALEMGTSTNLDTRAARIAGWLSQIARGAGKPAPSAS